MRKCYECRGTVQDNDSLLCDDCIALRDGGLLRLRFPGVSGVSDGPGSGNGQLCFSRPNVAKEMEVAFKRMEQDGKFVGHPERLASAQAMLKNAKSKFQPNIDYDKGWHPMDTNPHVKVESE